MPQRTAWETEVGIPRVPEGIETPAVCLDLAVVLANVRRMQQALSAQGLRVRPHVKTHKSLRIGRLQIDAGAQGITAATVGEAEVFANGGFDDIFIAYPVWAGGSRGKRIRDLHERVSLRVGFDSIDGAEQLARAARGARPLNVLVEIDCGARRSGVPPSEAGPLAVAAARLGLRVLGVFTYAGHGDRSPEARLAAANDEVTELARAVESLRRAGFVEEEVSGGSTPTALLSARRPVTESRPGEYVFYDQNKVALGICQLEDVALVVATTVVSTAVPGQVILDVGTKALGREGSPDRGYGHVPAVPGSFLRLLNEHHGYLTVPDEVTRPRVGDVLAIVPNHACPIVNLFDEYTVLQDGREVDRWPIDARGRQR
jgi:D-serine deaminase-like pyridoxal phosphate-dependent protein